MKDKKQPHDDETVPHVILRKSIIDLFLPGLELIKQRLDNDQEVLKSFEIENKSELHEHVERIIEYYKKKQDEDDFARGISFWSLRIIKAGAYAQIRELERKKIELIQANPELLKATVEKIDQVIQTKRDLAESGLLNSLKVPSYLIDLTKASDVAQKKFTLEKQNITEDLNQTFAPYMGLMEITDQELKKRCEGIFKLRIEEKNTHGEDLFDTVIRESATVLENRIKEKAKLPSNSNLSGIKLINNVFSNQKPKLIPIKKDEQNEGIRDLLSGLFAMIRNDSHHNLLQVSDRQALHICGFIDYTLALLEQFQTPKKNS
ncbi:MAG TPA: TIGR02391 family protein [Oligoflexia bacterium]|nr:TIGR02391 family protein [Oligoflexia bacterium]HMR25363.1 TIGR02391 family protein [Oligoflexia bacterium]